MMMLHPVGGDTYAVCSTAFAVLDGIEGRILSAAHCDTTGNWAWNNGDIGSPTQFTPGNAAVSVILSQDSMEINPTNGTDGKVFTGGIYGTQTDKVRGTAVNNVGDYVATDGANSGEHTGSTIYNDAVPDSCNGYPCTLIGAESPTHDAILVGGDSGGPVLNHYDDTHVTAKGVIHGGPFGSHVTCPTTRFTPGTYEWPVGSGNTWNKCFYRVVYYPIRPLLTSWGVTIETVP